MSIDKISLLFNPSVCLNFWTRISILSPWGSRNGTHGISHNLPELSLTIISSFNWWLWLVIEPLPQPLLRKLKLSSVTENWLKELWKLRTTPWVKKLVSLIFNALRISALELWRCSNSERKFKDTLKEEWKSSPLTLPALSENLSLPNLSLTLDLFPPFPSILLPQFKSSVLKRRFSGLLSKRPKHPNTVFFTILPSSVGLLARTKVKFLAILLTSALWLPVWTTFWLTYFLFNIAN